MPLIIYSIDGDLLACTDSFRLELTGGATVKKFLVFTHFGKPDPRRQMLQKNSPAPMIVVIQSK